LSVIKINLLKASPAFGGPKQQTAWMILIILACALAAQAGLIASGDSHLLDLKIHHGIKISLMLSRYPPDSESW
jgi:hypothetical protein